MWECPKCRREFKFTNQWHSCYICSVQEHFEGKSSKLKELYNEIEKFILSLGDFTITPTKTAILFRKSSTFAEIKLKKDCLVLAFSLNYTSDSKLINKIFKMSKNKIVHTINIFADNEMEEIFKLLLTANEIYIN
jgi:predicted transport protein